jgi:PKHD-type hydroxylase
MLLHIPQLLNAAQVAGFRACLQSAPWADGRVTAGHQSAHTKNNLQLREDDATAEELSAGVREALERSSLFFAAALPRRIFTPLFNCYRSGNGFGRHIDNAVRYDRTARASGEKPPPVRTDLSATLFLSAPEEYEGGELVIEDSVGAQRVKLPAGDLILYPASSVHRVEAIARGTRFASFFWVQSLVRDAGQRRELFDLDIAIQQLSRDHGEHPAMVSLVGTYHNLLRRWADT